MDLLHVIDSLLDVLRITCKYNKKCLMRKEKEFWQENGYLKLSIISSMEINEISDAYDKLFERKELENVAGLVTTWTGKDIDKLAGNIDYTVQSIHNLQMHSAVFTRLITNPNLLGVLKDIMDTEDILLHHTKAIVKPPEKGAPYLMHQDCHYFPSKKNTMLTVFLHLDDTTEENGALAVYPGSHKLGPLQDYVMKDEKNGEQYHYVNPEEYPLSKAKPVLAKKGDFVVCSNLLVHGSYLNSSTKRQRMLILQVRAADDEPLQDTVHKSVCQDFVLRGRNINREA